MALSLLERLPAPLQTGSSVLRLRPDDLAIASATVGPPLESEGRAGSVVGPELAGRPERAADPPPRPADSTADAISLASLHVWSLLRGCMPDMHGRAR